mgnify:CR=1 FL=1
MGTDADSVRGQLRSAMDRMLSVAGQPYTSASGIEARKMLLDTLVFALPLFAGLLTTMVNAINLYLAVRVAQVSGRLRRPMPELSTMRFPTWAPIVTALAFLGCLVPGMPGLLSGVLAAAMMMAYAILGFAVMHSITRGMGSRPLALGGLYSVVIVFGWPVLVMSMLGLADTAFDLRGRAARRRNSNHHGT